MYEWGKVHFSDYQFGALRLKGLRILVVVNEADVRDRLLTVLEERGAEVIIAESASEVLEVLRQVQPDALVVDIGVPSDDAYTLIRQVRGLATNTGQVPGVALTTSALDRRQALRVGFQIHLGKPIEPVELVAAIVSLARRLE